MPKHLPYFTFSTHAKTEIEPAAYRTQTEKSVAYARTDAISAISIGELQQDINMQH